MNLVWFSIFIVLMLAGIREYLMFYKIVKQEFTAQKWGIDYLGGSPFYRADYCVFAFWLVMVKAFVAINPIEDILINHLVSFVCSVVVMRLIIDYIEMFLKRYHEDLLVLLRKLIATHYYHARLEEETWNKLTSLTPLQKKIVLYWTQSEKHFIEKLYLYNDLSRNIPKPDEKIKPRVRKI